ncbi:MAG: PilX N-terminal domain-containing pilus assembly protein [Halofilum sp. (in: g-proteobacteria)]
MQRPRLQSGAVLVVSLLLLTVMTLLVLSAINTGNLNMRILENTRAKQEAEAVAELAVNEFFSDPTNFDPPSGGEISKGDYTVTIKDPECVATRPAEGYTAVEDTVIPRDTTWQSRATLEHGGSADVSIVFGVEIRMPQGSCPDPA